MMTVILALFAGMGIVILAFEYELSTEYILVSLIVGQIVQIGLSVWAIRMLFKGKKVMWRVGTNRDKKELLKMIQGLTIVLAIALEALSLPLMIAMGADLLKK